MSSPWVMVRRWRTPSTSPYSTRLRTYHQPATAAAGIRIAHAARQTTDRFRSIHARSNTVNPAKANGSGDTIVEEDAVDPSDPSGRTRFSLNKLEDDPRTPEDDAVKSQWTLTVELGAVF